MITNRVIQAWFDKANASDSDVMSWNDFLDCMDELKNTDTTALTVSPVTFSSLPQYADEAAAETGGLFTGQLYRTSTGEVRVKLAGV